VKCSAKRQLHLSKSYTIRGFNLRCAADGKSEIISPLASDDTAAAINVFKKGGVTIRQQKKSWMVSGGDLQPPTSDLFCGDSAATLRFMTAFGAIIPGICHLTAVHPFPAPVNPDRRLKMPGC